MFHSQSRIAIESAFSLIKLSFPFFLFSFLLHFFFIFSYLFYSMAMTKDTLPPIGHAAAGSAGAMFALSLVYPLDM